MAYPPSNTLSDISSKLVFANKCPPKIELDLVYLLSLLPKLDFSILSEFEIIDIPPFAIKLDISKKEENHINILLFEPSILKQELRISS